MLAHDSAEGEEATRGYDDVKYFLWDTPPYENVDTLAIARISKFVVDGRERPQATTTKTVPPPPTPVYHWVVHLILMRSADVADAKTRGGTEEAQAELFKEAEKRGKDVLIKLSVKLRVKSDFFGSLIGSEHEHKQEGEVTTVVAEPDKDRPRAGADKPNVPLQLLLQKRYTDPFTYTRVQELLYDLNESVKGTKDAVKCVVLPLPPQHARNSPSSCPLPGVVLDGWKPGQRAFRWCSVCSKIRRRGPSQTRERVRRATTLPRRSGSR